LTWYFMFKSIRIVKIIDREGLTHSSEIKSRLKRKDSTGPRSPRGKPGTKS
jgi:hypothetical protein